MAVKNNPETIGYKCSDHGCQVVFLRQDLVGGLIPEHTRNNDEMSGVCNGSHKEGVMITAADVPKVRGFSLLGL